MADAKRISLNVFSDELKELFNLRSDVEDARVVAEDNRKDAELVRIDNEIDRVVAEEDRVVAEGLRDSEFVEKINDFIAETDRVENEYSVRLTDVETDLAQHKLDYVEHLNSSMPHKTKDLQGNKTYKFGLQLSEEGNPQIIFEEVI